MRFGNAVMPMPGRQWRFQNGHEWNSMEGIFIISLVYRIGSRCITQDKMTQRGREWIVAGRGAVGRGGGAVNKAEGRKEKYLLNLIAFRGMPYAYGMAGSLLPLAL